MFKNGVILVAFALCVVVPWDLWFSIEMNLSNMVAGISSSHPFGTDNLGRDLLGRLSLAFRDSVLPSWLAVSLSFVSGVCLAILMLSTRGAQGLLAWVQSAGAVSVSLPLGIFCFLCAVYFEEASIFSYLLALSFVLMFRSFLEILNLYHRDENLGYWDAHKAMGGHKFSRLVKYGCLGSWRNELLRTYGFMLAIAVNIETALSYLGFGTQEPQASYGNILASHFAMFLKGDYRVAFFVVLALLLSLWAPLALGQMLNHAKVNETP